MIDRLDDLFLELQELSKTKEDGRFFARLRAAKETIREAVREQLVSMGRSSGIPYGFRDDADSCPMACKLDMPVDGGEGFPAPIRLFVMAFDWGVFPEYDALKVDDEDGDVWDQVCEREAVYSVEEASR